MWFNFYTLAQIAGDAQVDLRNEGIKQQRWAKARKSVSRRSRTR